MRRECRDRGPLPEANFNQSTQQLDEIAQLEERVGLHARAGVQRAEREPAGFALSLDRCVSAICIPTKASHNHDSGSYMISRTS